MHNLLSFFKLTVSKFKNLISKEGKTKMVSNYAGPLFTDDNLIGATGIDHGCGKWGHFLEDRLIFQHNGAPPHYIVPVREYLNEDFQQDGLIEEVQLSCCNYNK